MKLCFGGANVVEATVPKEQAGVLQGKRLVIRDRACTFAWAETEKAGEANHVCHSLALCGRAFVACKRQGFCDNPEWAWFHSVWGRILLAACLQLGGKSEVKFAGCCEAGVRGPQPGQRLPDRPCGVRHRISRDGDAAGGQPAVSVPSAEDLEEGCRIMDAMQQGVEAMLCAELHPDGPTPVLPGSTGCVNATSHRELQSAEVRFESICKFSQHMRHGLSCG